jgi:23S rRNA (cytosine1962-C5)-methyltransferase
VGQLRVRVTATAESVLRAGHPWLYDESIRSQSRPGKMGELAVVYDRRNCFLALGIFDPSSVIRLRVLLTGKPRRIDPAFWSERLAQTLQRRSGLFDDKTTGFRWINGESDGWPGFVLDRYDSTLVLKLYTAAWLPWLAPVLDAIETQLKPARIVLRLSRNVQEFANQHFGKIDGEILRGTALAGPVIFRETGLLFEADVLRGQKTGFFLDQRENRRLIEGLARGRSVLNAFSFSGGFSLYAARGGARWVLDLDISTHALKAADRNFALNEAERAVRLCDHETARADVFAWLGHKHKRKFDLVVLDPPSLAKRAVERDGALAAYSKLVSLGIKHLAAGGILLSCSCSAHVPAALFYDVVRTAAMASKRRFKEIGQTGQPADHHAVLDEAKYLKAIYLQFT